MDLKKLAARASGIRNLGMEIAPPHRLFPLERPRRSVERMTGVGIPVTPSHPYFSPSIFTPSFAPLSRSTLSLSLSLLVCSFTSPPPSLRLESTLHARPSFPSFFERTDAFPLARNRVPLIVLINNAPMIRRFKDSFFRKKAKRIVYETILFRNRSKAGSIRVAFFENIRLLSSFLFFRILRLRIQFFNSPTRNRKLELFRFEGWRSTASYSELL